MTREYRQIGLLFGGKGQPKEFHAVNSPKRLLFLLIGKWASLSSLAEELFHPARWLKHNQQDARSLIDLSKGMSHFTRHEDAIPGLTEKQLLSGLYSIFALNPAKPFILVLMNMKGRSPLLNSLGLMNIDVSLGILTRNFSGRPTALGIGRRPGKSIFTGLNFKDYLLHPFIKSLL